MKRALVIGAGIGGLASGIALVRTGFDVEILERAASVPETGAGISLWANALRALDRLGAGDAMRSMSVPYGAAGIRSWRGDQLLSIDTDELGRRFDVPVVVVHRADLLDALLQRVGAARVRFGSRCESVGQNDSTAIATLEGGERLEADLIVGADGLHSTVRKVLHGDAAPRYAGCTAWRSVVPYDLPDLHAGETWGHGSIFGRVPMSRGRVYWFATENVPAGEARSGDEKGRLLRLFKGWHAPIEALIAAADEQAILRNDLYDRPPLAPWGAGRITLAGDAAHPMTPFLGQGGCQALEDAAALGRALEAQSDIPAALGEYERIRAPRANMFLRRSRMVGRIARLEHPLAVLLRNSLSPLLNPRAQARQIARMLETD